MEVMGTGLRPTGFLVCGRCEDRPAWHLKAKVLPPDPVPVENPRPVEYGRDA
jgi:hypothetical protein